jgi:hypothetical protein
MVALPGVMITAAELLPQAAYGISGSGIIRKHPF